VPIVAEEMAEDGKCPSSAQASYFLVDALDGTGDFIAGRNEFTVNVALIRDFKPVAGVVYAPALGRIWSGAGLTGPGRGGDGGRQDPRPAGNPHPRLPKTPVASSV
jgi:3'(2'), 5'-bisphosphate nucleotidase